MSIIDKINNYMDQQKQQKFLKGARLLPLIDSDYIDYGFRKNEKTEELDPTVSYLNTEGFKLIASYDSNKDLKYSLAKNLAFGEDISATWSYDLDGNIQTLNIVDPKKFKDGIETIIHTTNNLQLNRNLELSPSKAFENVMSKMDKSYLNPIYEENKKTKKKSNKKKY